MATYKRVNNAVQTGTNRSKPISAERLVNLYVEKAPETAAVPAVLHGTPGQSLYLALSESPILAMHSFDDNLYVVSANQVFVIDVDKNVTSLGTIGTVEDPIQMLDNGINVVILNNSTGAAFLATSTTLTQITDADFRDASSMAFIDGYMAYTERNSDIWFISELRDASSYLSADFTRAEADSDDAIRIFATYKEVWVFGPRSIELYSNTGNVDFPFETQQGANFQQGLGAVLSVAQINNIVCWLGEDREVWAAVGYQPREISTPAIAEKIRALTTVSDAVGFTYSQEGHDFYVLVFPGVLTIAYDFETQTWHERKAFEKDDWNIETHAFFNGLNLVGDATTGNIYELDLDTYTDNGTTIERIIRIPPFFADKNKIFIDRLEVNFESGVGLLSGQGSDPLAMLRRSSDGGRTFSNELRAKIGARGKYNAVTAWRKLGQSKNCTFEIKVTDPVKVSVGGIYAWIRGGAA